MPALSEDGEHVLGELISGDELEDADSDVVATTEDLSEPPDPSVSEPESEPAGELSCTLLNDSLTGYESANETVSGPERDSSEEQDSTLLNDSSTVYESANEIVSDLDTSSDYFPDYSHNSFDSSSNSPPPHRPTQLRRSARNVVPPAMLTYDKVGTPVISRPR